MAPPIHAPESCLTQAGVAGQYPTGPARCTPTPCSVRAGQIFVESDMNISELLAGGSAIGLVLIGAAIFVFWRFFLGG